MGGIARLPSFAWTDHYSLSSRLSAQLMFSSHRNAEKFHASLRSSPLRTAVFGPDPIISAMESWSPVGPGGGIFGNRDIAHNLTGVTALRNATGKGVNVVVVDRGLDRNWIRNTAARMASRRGLPYDHDRPTQPVFGWTRFEWNGVPGGKPYRYIEPGASGSEHGHMIARNVLAIAPEAKIWDAPLLPPEEEPDAPPSLSTASTLFERIEHDIIARKISTTSGDSHESGPGKAEFDGPWILVNAWGVLDPESDASFLRYADDPDHFLAEDMTRLQEAKIDVVFAAGNCGEPCPDRRCGSQDCGPGRSIFGVNAHPNVMTVGAVRADGVPVALSAQGPGRLAVRGSNGTNDYTNNIRARDKPDLCAPTHFRESDDAAEVNTGTSGACGFAAGILAALRSVPKGRNLGAEEMREVLRRTARPAGPGGWDARLGFGVINAEDALADLLSNGQ